jgi:hypothetical protein
MSRTRRASAVTERVIDLEADTPRTAAGDAAARQVWEQLAGPLSHANMRLRSLRSRVPGDSPEARDLDEVIASIDRAFGAAMRTPPPTAIERPPPGAAPARVPVDEARDAFDRWIRQHAREPMVDMPAATSAEALLESLAAEVQSLPATTARELGLEPGDTYARAARLLLWARHAPGGPGCRSFRAACFFLAGAHTLPATPGAEASSTRRSTTDPAT